MARLDVRTQNPERYAQVKAEQEELKDQFSMALSVQALRGSPYCEHKIEILYSWGTRPFESKVPELRRGSSVSADCVPAAYRINGLN